MAILMVIYKSRHVRQKFKRIFQVTDIKNSTAATHSRNDCAVFYIIYRKDNREALRQIRLPSYRDIFRYY